MPYSSAYNMRVKLANPAMLLAAVAVFVSASAVATQGDGYNRRVTSEERAKAFERMEAKMSRLQKDPFCEPTSTRDQDDPPFPVLPTSFITQTEISFQDNNTVITGEEMYDGDKQTGVLKYKLVEGIFLTRPHVFQEEIHYSVPTNESLFIFGNNACEDEGGENCHPLKLCLGGNINDLSEEMKNLLGYSDLNPGQGFMGAGGILQWGPSYGYKYRSREACRAMDCDVYETCIKLDDTDNRVFIVYYWSLDGWKLNLKGQQVPVAVEIMSSGTIDPVTVKPFLLRYDFYDFLRDAKPDVASLEPPRDVYCYGMKDGKAPPKSSHYFSYKSETVTGFDIEVPDGDNQTKSIQFTTAINQEEFYDWDQKIASSKFIPRFLFTEESRFEHETLRVQDFNQGLHYNIKLRLGTCHIHPIENLTSFGDVIVNEDGSVEMLPPWAFDHLDEPMKYTGEHWVRGIDTDVWIGTQKAQFIPFLNESFVWYYASPLMTDDEAFLDGGSNAKGRKDVKTHYSMEKIPVQFEKYLSLFEALPHHIYNIYEYEDEPPMTHILDISLCYTDDQMIHYFFDLPADSIIRVKHLRDKLMYATQTVLAEFGVVSALRINRLVLEERSDAIRVLFTILGKPQVEGDAPGTDLESTKEEAASMINEALNKHQFIILVPLLNLHEGEIIAVLPLSDSLTSVSRSSTHHYSVVHNRGYSSGSMAGLAIGMLFVGAIVAVVINVVIQKRRGNSTDIPRVTMGKKSSNTGIDSVDLGSNLAGGSDI